MSVRTGDRVTVHYEAYGTGGNVLASTYEHPPAVLTAGGDGVIPGLSHGVLGMSVGEEKLLCLTPEETFGAGVSAVLRSIPKCKLPKQVALGDMVRLTLGPMSILLWVIESRKEGWLVSTQHPLAGQRMNLRLKIVAVQ